MDKPIKQHLIEILEAFKRYEDRREARIQELETQGRRIVDGGQTSSYGEDGKCDWEITDWRTGEVIASGRGTIEDYDAAGDASDPEHHFFHIDHVSDDDDPLAPPYDVRPTEGVPDSLSRALIEWAENSGTSNEDIAIVLGWSIEKVAEFRKED